LVGGLDNGILVGNGLEMSGILFFFGVEDFFLVLLTLVDFHQVLNHAQVSKVLDCFLEDLFLSSLGTINFA